MTAEQQDALTRLFWTKVAKTDTCWLWTGKPGTSGYGRIYAPGGGRSPLYAHRVSYEIHKGPIPDGLTIDHLCRNRMCVNPDHLEAVTFAVNNLRAAPHRTKVGRRRTHCRRGHSMDDAIVVRRGDGRVSRQCRPCAQERGRRNDKRPRKTPQRGIGHLGQRTHCRYGHEFTPDNTVISQKPRPHRVCLTCRQRYQQTQNARRRAQRRAGAR